MEIVDLQNLLCKIETLLVCFKKSGKAEDMTSDFEEQVYRKYQN